MSNILIAEDDGILALYLKSLLVDLGFEENSIRITDTGKKASKLSKKLKPYVIFMDISMEFQNDGIDASRIINQQNPLVKIIFVSAYPEYLLTSPLTNVIYDDYLEKPFKQESIRKSLIKIGLLI